MLARSNVRDPGEYWSVSSHGEDVRDLLKRLRRQYFVYRDAFAILDTVTQRNRLIERGPIQLSALSSDECRDGLATSTTSVLAEAARRGYRMATIESAMLLALTIDPADLGSPYAVIMHEGVYVPDEAGVPQKRVLGIAASPQFQRPTIVAPRIEDDCPWRSDRIFVFRSAE